uniref:Uncharacterized protein n=1 Tax=Plectus sambesii TaxID=2011161 RepID=A0A914VQY4_9BILA
MMRYGLASPNLIASIVLSSLESLYTRQPQLAFYIICAVGRVSVAGGPRWKRQLAALIHQLASLSVNDMSALRWSMAECGPPRLIGFFCVTIRWRAAAEAWRTGGVEGRSTTTVCRTAGKGRRTAIDENGKWAFIEMEGEGLTDHQRRFFATQSPLEPPVDAVGDRSASHQERF